MAYEVDFLPVGNGDTSGDAIAVRWEERGTYKVLVYDGGTKASGEAMVNHIKTHYQTNRVDYVVNSHPDNDHASGLAVILEQLEVGELWMHRPWQHSQLILDYFKDGRITDNSLAERLKEKMAAAYALEELATQKLIPIYEPFEGGVIGPFTVLTPERDWYIHELIQAFAKSPDAKESKVASGGLLGIVAGAMKKAAEWISEHWHIELLRENVETSAENESSVVLFADFDGHGVLLTGDAGVQALHRAADHAEEMGVDLPTRLKFIQVPHHGSRNNVSSTCLDRLIGPRKATSDDTYTKTAFVSAGKESTTHPRQMVVNAFLRRGARVYPTKGNTIWHRDQMPARGWGPATGMAFSSTVEAWND